MYLYKFKIIYYYLVQKDVKYINIRTSHIIQIKKWSCQSRQEINHNLDFLKKQYRTINLISEFYIPININHYLIEIVKILMMFINMQNNILKIKVIVMMNSLNMLKITDQVVCSIAMIYLPTINSMHKNILMLFLFWAEVKNKNHLP